MPALPSFQHRRAERACLGTFELAKLLRAPAPGCGQFGVMNYLAAEGIASRRGLCAHRPAYPAGSWSCTPMQAVAIVRVVAAPELAKARRRKTAPS